MSGWYLTNPKALLDVNELGDISMAAQLDTRARYGTVPDGHQDAAPDETGTSVPGLLGGHAPDDRENLP